MRKHDVVRSAASGGEKDEEKAKSDGGAHKLRHDEAGNRRWGDAGEGVAEDAPDCHGRVRE